MAPLVCRRPVERRPKLPGRKAPRKKGPVDAYLWACSCLGQQPSPEIRQDLREHGALVVDLQLCLTPEVLLLFLREAPPGVQQLVLYSGDMFFSDDDRYRIKLKAQRRREPQGILRDEEMLRQLMASLVVFLSIRGSTLAVLELTGIPLGRSIMAMLSPMARCLPDCVPGLQRLHLAGCGLQDRGLEVLLPHLAKGLPKLSHLSLARNGLRDVRLLAHLLQGRAAAQRKGKAVPLCILDLSQNPSLGTVPALHEALPFGAAFPPTAAKLPHRIGQRPYAPRFSTSPPGARAQLLQVLCDVLQPERISLSGAGPAPGLLLKTLRLRHMDLRDEDLRPLTSMLLNEVSKHQAGIPWLEGQVGPLATFPLKEISLEGNRLAAEFPTSVNMALRQLSDQSVAMRALALRQAQAAQAAQPRGAGRTPKPRPQQAESQRPSRQLLLSSCRSMPILEQEQARSSRIVDEIQRDALSDGDAADIDLEDLGSLRRFVASPRLDALMADTPSRPHSGGSSSQRDSGASAPGELGVIALEEIPDHGAALGFAPMPGILAGPPSDESEGSLQQDMLAGLPTRIPGRQREEQPHHAQQPQAASYGTGEITRDPASSTEMRRPMTAGGPGASPGRGGRAEHARMAMLQRMFQQAGNAPIGPEVMQFVLEVVNSDTSLHEEEAEGAFESLMAQQRRRQHMTMANQETDEDPARALDMMLMNMFSQLDPDGEGWITKRALLELCFQNPEAARIFGLPAYEEDMDDASELLHQMELFFQRIDTEHTHQISWEEFRRFYWTEVQGVDPDRAQRAFPGHSDPHYDEEDGEDMAPEASGRIAMPRARSL
eukprot:TRINITY_DN21685_c0_g1_i1.p1 TRINITY_DN21685_c0_g1~~TRINITY_DN21685_c0_g1_i1.p1  ORF type:complete len:829 (-),score=183.17 TRINITY_DN21685_c0_g1_i1:176-2662(-)